MTTHSNEQKELIANKDVYENLKSKLLKEYKGYAQNLEHAEDTFEEGIYLEKREKLAVQIKDLGAKLREIETLV